MVSIIVFENDRERGMMGADFGHDWDNQKNIFGCETEKTLKLCEEIFHSSLLLDRRSNPKAVPGMLKKLYGIAKTHHLRITWYGNSESVREPDRFLVSGHGHDRLAFIQC